MNRTVIYLITFLVVLLPVVGYVLFTDNTSASRKKKEEENEMPSIFRLCATPVAIVDALGFGSLIHRLFPASCRAMRKKLQYAGLDIAPAFVPTATWTSNGVTMIEAFEQPGYPLLAVQWHPERAYRDPHGLTNMDPLFHWLVEKARD